MPAPANTLKNCQFVFLTVYSMLTTDKSEEITMAKEEKNFIKIDNKKEGAAGFAMFLSFVGAAVYFVNQVDGFWNVIAALLKAAVWPAIVTYNVLQFFTA